MVWSEGTDQVSCCGVVDGSFDGDVEGIDRLLLVASLPATVGAGIDRTSTQPHDTTPGKTTRPPEPVHSNRYVNERCTERGGRCVCCWDPLGTCVGFGYDHRGLATSARLHGVPETRLAALLLQFCLRWQYRSIETLETDEQQIRIDFNTQAAACTVHVHLVITAAAGSPRHRSPTMLPPPPHPPHPSSKPQQHQQPQQYRTPPPSNSNSN